MRIEKAKIKSQLPEMELVTVISNKSGEVNEKGNLAYLLIIVR